MVTQQAKRQGHKYSCNWELLDAENEREQLRRSAGYLSMYKRQDGCGHDKITNSAQGTDAVEIKAKKASSCLWGRNVKVDSWSRGQDEILSLLMKCTYL